MTDKTKLFQPYKNYALSLTHGKVLSYAKFKQLFRKQLKDQKYVSQSPIQNI